MTKMVSAPVARWLHSEENGISSIIELSVDGTLLSASQDGSIKRWRRRRTDVGGVELVQTFSGHLARASALFELDETSFASASYDSTLKLWSLAATATTEGEASGGRCLATLRGHNKPVRCMILLRTKSNNAILVSGSDDGFIKLWRLNTEVLSRRGRRRLRRERSDDVGDEQALVVDDEEGGGEGVGECIKTLEGHTGAVWTLCELEKKIIASGSFDRSIKLWRPSRSQESNRGGCVLTLVGHTNSVRGIVSLAKGIFASCSADKTVRFWNRRSGQCLLSFVAHSSAINSLLTLKKHHYCYNNDNDKGNDDRYNSSGDASGVVVSGSWDGSIRGWNDSGECLFCCDDASLDSVTSLTELSDGSIASGSASGVIQIWNIAPFHSLVELCCAAVAKHHRRNVEALQQILPTELYDICLSYHHHYQQLIGDNNDDQQQQQQQSQLQLSFNYTGLFNVIKSFLSN